MLLRQRLDGVAQVAISQSDQTARVDFGQGKFRFEPARFRSALEDAGLELVDVQVEVCGSVTDTPAGRSLQIDDERWPLDYTQALPAARVVCLAGLLDDRVHPTTLRVTSLISSID